MTFDEAFDRLIGFEGGYADDPRDPGGETMWGVTRRVALQEGYTGIMRVLPRDTAKAIYAKRYWAPVQADTLPDAIRYPVFDAAVNSGVAQSVKWLQRALDIVDDGDLGAVTLAALGACDPERIVARFCGFHLDFLTSLPTWGAYGRGWVRRVASILQETT